ncbi:hypothetical protein PG993_013606 [Apiospora rasikravindrae]|uniref:Uncharacterized protein n=1 Tax=Apiospora rasikravindrae TaxID=990691 RepID=A0ABR1RY48_9PEZI
MPIPNPLRTENPGRPLAKVAARVAKANRAGITGPPGATLKYQEARRSSRPWGNLTIWPPTTTPRPRLFHASLPHVPMSTLESHQRRSAELCRPAAHPPEQLYVWSEDRSPRRERKIMDPRVIFA